MPLPLPLPELSNKSQRSISGKGKGRGKGKGWLSANQRFRDFFLPSFLSTLYDFHSVR
jgi:hypothetical protein